MAAKDGFFGESKQKITEYIQDRLLLLKLDTVERGANIIATMFTILMIALFSFFVLLFLSVMAAYLFGELLGHIFWGFGIVAGIYIILLAILIVYRKKFIHRTLMNTIINIVFEQTSEENQQAKQEATDNEK
jgi:hypothetical protein